LKSETGSRGEVAGRPSAIRYTNIWIHAPLWPVDYFSIHVSSGATASRITYVMTTYNSRIFISYMQFYSFKHSFPRELIIFFCYAFETSRNIET
jgi:hypothetical protein